MTVGETTVSTDEAIELLMCERRRAVLTHLRDRGEGVVSLGDLATAVAGECSEAPRSDVEVQLHHVDLPKLEAAGLVHYDAGTNRVVCPDTEPLAAVCSVLDSA